MKSFFVVTLYNLTLNPNEWAKVTDYALETCSGLGIEEYSLNEPEVDQILGDRSYSGGDLPLDVLDEVDTKVMANPGHVRFFFNDAEGANKFKNFCSKFLCECQLDVFKEEDWNAEWKKHYSPILVNEYLEIIPAWMGDYKSKARVAIKINPGMGFGTGSHETTFLCLKLFTEKLLYKSINSVLDFGSGSGILGLSVFCFFKDAKVDFYDIDSEANKNCYQNAELNGFAENSFRLLLPEYRGKLNSSYDLVFANILEGVLLSEGDALVNFVRPGGHIILSGLLKHQAPAVINKYLEMNTSLIQVLEKGDWSAAILRRDR